MHAYVTGSVALLLVNAYYLYDFTVQAKKNAPPDYKEFTEMKSLWKTAVATIVFVFLERFIKAVAPAYLAPFCKIQEDPNDPTKAVEKQRRVTKMASQFYKLLYFLGATAYGYITLRDSYFIPPELGGIGDLD